MSLLRGLCGGLCLLLANAAFAGTVVFDSLGPADDCYICNGNPFTNPTGYAIGGPLDIGSAFRFDTGDVSGYLDEITLALVVSQESTLPALEQFTAFIYDDNTFFTVPGVVLHSESYSIAPSEIFGNIIFTLPTSQTFFLEEQTTYWLAFTASTDSSLGWIYNADVNWKSDNARQIGLGGSWFHINTPVPGLRITAVSEVPVPAVGWLLGLALGVVGWVRRHAAA